MVCIKNNSFIVVIGPILNKELKLMYQSDALIVRTFIVRYHNIIYDKMYLYKRNAQCILFCI